MEDKFFQTTIGQNTERERESKRAGVGRVVYFARRLEAIAIRNKDTTRGSPYH